MAAYSYHALNALGKTVKGMVEGDSLRQVRSQLRAQQLKPLEVKAVVQKEPQSSNDHFFWQRSLKAKELSLLTRQLASLVASGLPLDEALQATARQSRKPHVKSIILQVRTKVVEGLSLAQALAYCPKSFDPMYRALVNAGESSGYLGTVLEQLAHYTETSQYNRQKLRMAMVYPLVLLSVSLVVVGILMTFVVPKLISIFEHSHRELPSLTKALIAISHFSADYGIWCVGGVMILLWALRRSVQSPPRQRLWHGVLLKLPVVGHFIVQAECARFAATLSLLTGSGVTLVEALTIATQVFNNRVLRERAGGLAIAVSEGASLARAMDKAEFFPPLLVQMAASGESNGELANQLDHAARNQDRELELLLGTLTGLMEPLTVIVMGAIVTVIVMAILLPIFDLNSLV